MTENSETKKSAASRKCAACGKEITRGQRAVIVSPGKTRDYYHAACHTRLKAEKAAGEGEASRTPPPVEGPART